MSSNTDDTRRPDMEFSIHIIELCYQYIETNNFEALALIARQKGLPNFLRYLIWPLLLKTHPYVIDPYINPNYEEEEFEEGEELGDGEEEKENEELGEKKREDKVEEEGEEEKGEDGEIIADIMKNSNNGKVNEARNGEDVEHMEQNKIESDIVSWSHGRADDEKDETNSDSRNVSDTTSTNSGDSSSRQGIPVKEIRSDLKRYYRKLFQSNPNTAGDYSDLNTIEQRIFKTLEYSIVKFLRKWGRIQFQYEPGLAWIALGLAEWFPPLFNSKYYTDYQNDPERYVLVGKDTSLSRFLKKNDRVTVHKVNGEDSDSSTQKSDTTTETSVNSGSAAETTCIIDLYEEFNILFDDFLVDNEKFEQFKETLKKMNENLAQKNKLSFPEVYERLVLVILHSEPPEESKRTRKYPIWFPIEDDKVSFFVSLLKSQVKDIYSFLKEEGVLVSNYSFIDKSNDWVVWWIKWCGSKVLDKQDRGRLWDLLLGWRPLKAGKLITNADISISKDDLKSLGKDVFLDTLLNSNDESTKVSKEILQRFIERQNFEFRRLFDEEFKPEDDLPVPYSLIDPHTQLAFVYLSLLRSQENLLFELDQAEIRQVLSNGLIASKKNKMLKLKTSKTLKSHHKSYVTYNDDNEKSDDTSDAASSVTAETKEKKLEITGQHQNRHHKDKSVPLLIDQNSDDIDDIIQKSGNFWRKWVQKELKKAY